MKWITRERVKVDRVACPWLIKRFVDPNAEFLFVPTDQVAAIAAREGAIPYDVGGAELGHHGAECSFDAIVKKYNVTDPAVLELEPVELEIARVGDQRVLGLAVEAAEITLDERHCGLGFAEQAEIADRDFRPGAGAKRHRIGLPGDAVLVDILPPEPEVEERLHDDSGGERRRGEGGAKQSDKQFLHV